MGEWAERQPALWCRRLLSVSRHAFSFPSHTHQRTFISPLGLQAHIVIAFLPVAGAMDMHEPSGRSSFSAKGEEGASLAWLLRGGMAPAADDAPSSTPDPALPVIVSLRLLACVGCVWLQRGCVSLVYVEKWQKGPRRKPSRETCALRVPAFFFGEPAGEQASSSWVAVGLVLTHAVKTHYFRGQDYVGTGCVSKVLCVDVLS